MSSNFNGFSEIEIQKFKKGYVINEAKKTSLLSLQTKSKPRNNYKSIKNETKEMESLTNVNNIPDEARLCIQKEEIANSENLIEMDNKLDEKKENHEIDSNLRSYELLEQNLKIDLEKFQSEQECIKEENRRRKEFLTKAIQEKTKKTSAEIHRLETLQNELKKLDSLLSTDISIIREQIEKETLEYNEILKRFNRVENEFVTLKALLKQKNERKELLTRHLCTIIEQNEQRKAEKLSTLINELNITCQKDIDDFEKANAIKN